MEAKFSPRVKDVISFSREEALRLGHEYIGTEHLLLGLIREGEGMAIKILKSLGINLGELRKSVENSIRGSSTTPSNMNNIPLTKQAEKALKITYLEAKIFKTDLIGTEHLLLSILKDEDNIATQILNQYGINYDIVKEELDVIKSNFKSDASQNPADDDPYAKDDEGSSGANRAAPCNARRGRAAAIKAPGSTISRPMTDTTIEAMSFLRSEASLAYRCQ